MIQTTLLSYFYCNNNNHSIIKHTENQTKAFKQTSLKDYYKIIPKKKSILDYFKPKKNQVKDKKKEFELTLVDIKNTRYSEIKCVKKNINEKDLKYIAISYRWGELDEQQVQTPDYTAHITSFHLWDLVRLCLNISKEQDLKEIRYLWIDAISVNQQHPINKKETLLKMNHIYKKASYIVAIPDLHQFYLRKNLLNNEIMNLIWEKQDILLKNISHYHHKNNKQEIKNNVYGNDDNDDGNVDDDDDEDIKKAYQYLAYLIQDWSNRVWVISEYQIAKEKYDQYGTPLKFMFMSLLSSLPPLDDNHIHFFSHYFDNNGPRTTINHILSYTNVMNSNQLIHFLNTRFLHKSYMDMILNSNASKNEDRFNAILPLWKKKRKNHPSSIVITDKISVRLKLYDIMNDLWDNATLLYACSGFALQTVVILPSFASYYDDTYLKIIEKENIPLAYELYKTSAISSSSSSSYSKLTCYDFYHHKVNDTIKYDESSLTSIYTENLKSIQFHQYYLSIQSSIYFIYQVKDIWLDEIILSYSSLERDDYDCLYYVFIPFFKFTLPDCLQVPPPMTGSNICLLGNKDKNRWVLFNYESFKNKFNSYHFCSDHYTFNIY
ncbi:unnamed protein product [Cunninghamella blakesleeana]